MTLRLLAAAFANALRCAGGQSVERTAPRAVLCAWQVGAEVKTASMRSRMRRWTPLTAIPLIRWQSWSAATFVASCSVRKRSRSAMSRKGWRTKAEPPSALIAVIGSASGSPGIHTQRIRAVPERWFNSRAVNLPRSCSREHCLKLPSGSAPESALTEWRAGPRHPSRTTVTVAAVG